MAGMVSKQVIEEIRSRTDIVEVVQARVPLRRAGNAFVACCPFHKERTPSFNVSPSRQMYKCFGCGEGGDVFSFLMKHDGMTFGDALRMLGDRCGVKVSFERDDGREENRKRLLAIHAEVAAFYRRCLLSLEGARHARDYLASRDLSREVCEQFAIGFAPAAQDALLRFAAKHRFANEEMIAAGLLAAVERNGRPALHDRFRRRLMFPIQDSQGRVVAFSGRVLEKNARVAKYVNSPETAIFVKSRTLYALDKAQRHIVSAPNRQAIVCEGQIDTIRCHACGFPTAVAAQGTAFTEDHVRILKRYADSALLVFDPDAAGQKAAVRTAGQLLATGIPVRIARLPEGEDPDSFLRQRGPDAFREVLEGAEEVIPFQIRLLQVGEQDPRSADALGRISSGLLDTIRLCGNAIHRARMLQEASELLALPESALREELERRMEEESRRASSRAPGSVQSPSHRQTALEERSRIELDALLVPDEDMPTETDVVVDGAAAPDPALRVRPSPQEYGLCELLIHNLDDTAMVGFVAKYVPMPLFRHPYCRALASAICERTQAGSDALLTLQENGPADLVEFIAGVVRSPDRSGFGEFTEMDAAKDLILGLWRQHLEDRRKGMVGAADELADRPVQERLRAELAVEIRALRQWESGVRVIGRRIASLETPHDPGKSVPTEAEAR